MTKFTAKYEVDDGYAGGSRPQTFEIDESEIDEDMDERDIEELFLGCMQDDFEQSITPEPSGDSLEEFKEWAKGVIAQRGQDESNG